MGNQSKRSRLAALAGGRAAWDQDFAFAIVLPLRTRWVSNQTQIQNPHPRAAPLWPVRLQVCVDSLAAAPSPLPQGLLGPCLIRPLRLELHQSNGRKRGRLLARAYIPLATLFPDGDTEGARRLCCVAEQRAANA